MSVFVFNTDYTLRLTNKKYYKAMRDMDLIPLFIHEKNYESKRLESYEFFKEDNRVVCRKVLENKFRNDITQNVFDFLVKKELEETRAGIASPVTPRGSVGFLYQGRYPLHRYLSFLDDLQYFHYCGMTGMKNFNTEKVEKGIQYGYTIGDDRYCEDEASDTVDYCRVTYCEIDGERG